MVDPLLKVTRRHLVTQAFSSHDHSLVTPLFIGVRRLYGADLHPRVIAFVSLVEQRQRGILFDLLRILSRSAEKHYTKILHFCPIMMIK